MSILVVYYSRSGMTKKIAQAIAEKLGADQEEIISLEERKGLSGYLKSGQEAAQKKLAKIKPPEKKVGDYDLVIVGTPVWVGTMSSPVRTYLNSNLGRFRTVAFFTTQGSIKDQKVFKELTEVLGKDPIATLKVKTKEAATDDYTIKLEKFLKEVKS